MQVLAGWTALSGLDKQGNAGTLGGFDACGDSAAVAGVVVPVNPGFKGLTGSTSGNPAVDSVGIDSVHIDWNAIINQGLIKPTITIPGGSWPTATQWADTSFYPIILVKQGNFDLPSAGRGMLIVQGHLTMNGSTGWKGVILVGGDIVSNGDNSVSGATVSGLNVKLGTYVPASTANGTKTYQYNSCEVSKATTPAGALVTLRNTWVDNWVEY
jgi:hypothetical protein